MPSSSPSHFPDSRIGGASPIAPKVFIVALNWNGISDTLECLRSLMQLTYPRWQAVVVDNGSRGDEAAVIRANFSAVTVNLGLRGRQQRRHARRATAFGRLHLTPEQ
jgi:GT2 family glycosyltransferase